MSIAVINAVWEHSKSKNRARVVLLAIADMQGEIGAWPSLSTLAKMANASERSVQRDIQTLIELGELRVEIQSAPIKRQYKSNLYWVTLPGVTNSVSGVTDSTSGVTDLASGVTAGGVQTLNRTITEPLREPEQNKFEEFWEAYPRKEGKPSSLVAYKKAIKNISEEELIQAAKDYAVLSANTQKQYIRKAFNWLRDEEFLTQEKPKPSGGGIWDQPTI